MRHTLLFAFQYSMFTKNFVTISPFNGIGVVDVACPLGFKANHFLLHWRKGNVYYLRQVGLEIECQTFFLLEKDNLIECKVKLV